MMALIFSSPVVDDVAAAAGCRQHDVSMPLI